MDKIRLEAAARLHAAMADARQAIVFLTELGFHGLVFKSDKEDLIKFYYRDYDKAKLKSMLGNPKPAEKSIRFNFGKSGVIAIWEKNKTVVLRNSRRGGRSADIPNDVFDTPVEKPVVKDPIKTGTENDDSHVPIVHISPELHAEYQRAQRNTSYQLKFIQDLWKYLNKNKFGSSMVLPEVRIMKEVKGTSFRLRGYWRAYDREFAISRRLFKATQNFFVEVVLHEMCHQAVSEIDSVLDKTDQGHGPDWQRWMRKVGLNPLRFDPNENTTYMDNKEKDALATRKAKNQIAIEKLDDADIKPMRIKQAGPVTTVWDGEIYDGIAICPALASGTKWAFIPFADLNKYTYGTNVNIQWKIISLYAYQPRVINGARDSLLTRKIMDVVINHYAKKKELRKRRADLRRDWDY